MTVYQLVKHKVADYDKWKQVFDEDGERRGAAGCKGVLILRDPGDANLVTFLMEWESKEAADAFGATPGSHAVGRRAGVTSDPEVTVFHAFDRTGR